MVMVIVLNYKYLFDLPPLCWTDCESFLSKVTAQSWVSKTPVPIITQLDCRAHAGRCFETPKKKKVAMELHAS